MKIKTLLTGLFIQTSLFLFSQTTVVDSIVSGGIYRSYRVYIPAAYTGSTARPLVFDLHGYTSNASSEQFYSNFMPIADTANFLVVYPQGTNLNGQPYWNAGFGPGVNDIQFISELIDTLKNTYTIDPNSIYSCGMSNGGFMSQTLACELNNKIAAIASVTGSMTTLQYSTCNPARPVPMMQVSGNADGTVPYAGSSTAIHIDTLVRYWVLKNNCNLTPQFNNVPNTNMLDGCTAEHYVYSGGIAGASCELYKIIGGGHTWPGSPYTIGTTNQDFSASLKIWLFFRKYKLNQFVGIQEVKNNENYTIYPNPCTNTLTVDNKAVISITIKDLTGKVVIETSTKQIDVSALAKGIYSVELYTYNYMTIKKLVKL
ncbi:MAG: T9SS type A sorting domain-containing protein [Bacteroidota bacterium]